MAKKKKKIHAEVFAKIFVGYVSCPRDVTIEEGSIALREEKKLAFAADAAIIDNLRADHL